MMIETVIVGRLETNCFVVSDEETGEACVIDPGDEPDKISACIDANSLRPVYIICTHAHYDHVCAVRELMEKYRPRLIMHERERKTYEDTKRLCMSWGFEEEDFPVPDVAATDGDEFRVGGICLRVIHTPGHTPGGMCMQGTGVLFTGDTLFRGSAGRTDLPGGDMGALLHSLKKLMQLPPATRVLCGHEKETTIGREAGTNPFMNPTQHMGRS
jgi:glyoxylase-like metal-dependent hydrolase (beta-lactamase superfamily II)